MLNSIGGLNILVDDLAMVDYVEDWSKVRSPSRAIRRLKRGFKQNIATKAIPKKEAFSFNGNVIMHSEMYRKLKEAVNAQESSTLFNPFARNDLPFRKGDLKLDHMESAFLKTPWMASTHRVVSLDINA